MRLRGIGPEVLLLCFLVDRGGRLRARTAFGARPPRARRHRILRGPRSPGERSLRPRRRGFHPPRHQVSRGRDPVRARQPDAQARRSGPRHRHSHRARRKPRPGHSRAGHSRAGSGLHERGPHGSGRREAAQPARARSATARPRWKSWRGSTSSNTTGARRWTCGANFRPKNNANGPRMRRTTAANLRKRRCPPAISLPLAPSWPRRGSTLRTGRAPACWLRVSRRPRVRNRARSSSTPRRSRVRAPWKKHSCRRRIRHSARAPRSSTPGCGRSHAPNRIRRNRMRVFVVSSVESAASLGIGAVPAAVRGIPCAVSNNRGV